MPHRVRETAYRPIVTLDAEANVFNRLLESNRKRQRRLGGIVASTILHTLLIGLAVKATMLTAATPRTRVDVIRPIYRPPQPPEPTPSSSNNEPSTGSRTETLLAPPKDIKPIGPIDLDLAIIPPPGTTGPIVDSRDFRQPSGSPGPAGPVSPNVNPGDPLTESVVDIPVLAIPGTGNPRYPSTLQSAGLEGDVRAQFVVDTLGRVERGSVRVLDTTHELFASAVRDALTRARFKPAVAGGHLVRQLAEQTFTFRITK